MQTVLMNIELLFILSDECYFDTIEMNTEKSQKRIKIHHHTISHRQFFIQHTYLYTL